jgi:hypothetical protein
MRPLTDVEFDILNAIYFVEPFDKILEEVHLPENILADALKFLIVHKLATAMKWDEAKNTWVRSFIYDSDNMRAFHYLVTKDGLYAHNTR